MKYFFLLFTYCLFAQSTYYVTTSGSNVSSGEVSEPWSITRAVGSSGASSGDTVYIKAGNYGNKKLTVKTNGVIYIGYTTTPGDVTISTWSTYDEDQTPSSSVMPLFTGNDTGTAWFIEGANNRIENILINNYRKGVDLKNTAINTTLKNIDVRECGTGNESASDNSSSGDGYNGFSFHLGADNSTVIGCIGVDATAENFNAKASDNGYMQWCRSVGTNNSNPVDYHFLLSSNQTDANFSENWLIEDCYAESHVNAYHKGHGFFCKDKAEYNVFRRCHVKDTQFEVGFSGVRYNLFEDCVVEGTNSSNYGAKVNVENGARDNTFRNFFFYKAYCMLFLKDHNDGYVGFGGDRDLARVGDDNVFENFIGEQVDAVIRWSYGGGGDQDAIADGFILKNWTVNTVNSPVFNATSFVKSNWQMINIGVNDPSVRFNNNDFTNLTSTNCFYNGGSEFPSGWTGGKNASFVNAGGTNAEDYKLNSDSDWIDAGSASGTTLDYEGLAANGTRDIGAFEYQGGAPSDTTPPVISNITVDNITDNSFRVSWDCNEGCTGQIEIGTSSGTYTQSTILASIGSSHIQSPGDSPPQTFTLSSSTLYYWRIVSEDSSGNVAYSTQQTTTTTGTPAPPAEIDSILKVKGWKWIKKLKL